MPRAIFRNREAVQRQSGETAAALEDLVTAINVQPLEVGESKIRSGAGSPEGRLIGRPGDLYLRTDGGVGQVAYSKVTGVNTTTGWSAGVNGGTPGAHHASHETGGSDALTALSATILTSGSLADARLSSNVPLLNASNTFVATQVFSNANPALYFNETDQGADLKLWRVIVDGQVLFIQTMNDAQTVVTTMLSLSRAGALSLPGGQVAFPATQVPSSNANTLDDYEEGGWTPSDASGAGLVITSTFPCLYIKVGRHVTVTGYVNYPATASGAAAIIGGLPFTCSGTNGTGAVGYTTATVQPTVYVRESSTRLEFFTMPSSASIVNSTLSGKVIAFTAAYFATA